jgi:hypothetical protein
MSQYYTSVSGGGTKTVQFTSGDTLHDAADLYAIVEGEYKGTPSTESEQLKSILANLQAGKPLSEVEWEQLTAIKDRYASQLTEFRASPENPSQGFIPLPDNGEGRLSEAFAMINATRLLPPTRRL